MRYSVKQFISELIDNQVITDDIAKNISAFYQQKEDSGGNRLLAIFGILGALLVGIGIILIVAHNWDNLGRSFKTLLALVPVLLGLGACGYSLFIRKDSFTWKEGSAVFLTFAFGACMALISQIYNIPGSLQDFLLTWIIAIIPLVYIMWSSITSLLLIIAIVSFGTMAGYENVLESGYHKYLCWLFLGLLIPFYLMYWKDHPKSNALYFHHWLLPGAATILLGTLNVSDSVWVIPSYMAMFGCFYLFSETRLFNDYSLMANGYRVLGSLGTIFLLIVLSFHSFWENIVHKEFSSLGDFTAAPFIVTLILTALGIFLISRKRFVSESYLEFTFLVFIPIFLIGFWSVTTTVVAINLLILAFSVFTIHKGVKSNHLGIVNYGLLSITTLIICRFFDVDIAFFLKGLIFILVGFAFFLTNYRIIQNRKTS